MAGQEAIPRDERRVVTVLFADLVGFTERSEALDPEDVRALLTTYYAQVRAELERHGGVVDKFIGDAVMAVFGAPVAHEDDPERAVRAALAICEWARAREDVDLRIGLNTGTALVALEPSATGIGIVAGDVVNTASRVQSAAPTDGVLVTESTFRATAEVFEYREHDSVEAKGKAEPIRVWEPIRARAAVGDTRRVGDTPLVGRKRELAILREAYERVLRGRRPHIVTLVGVPGIGKTRLVNELEELVRKDSLEATWLAGRSLSYGAGSSLWSLAEIVRARAGIMETDDAARAEARLRAAVEAAAEGTTDAGWLLGHLRPLVGLGADGSGREDGQAEAFAAWRRFFELLAARFPVVLVFEDLHWADDAVLAFVDELAEHAEGSMLLVATARPEILERRPEWGSAGEGRETVVLEPLSDAETAQLLHGLSGVARLSPELEDTLLARAAGNPLYAEEFARMAAAGGSPDMSLPESVHGIVAARLDVVPPEEKDVLQDAAVLGQSFWFGALAHVGGRKPRALRSLLDRLEQMEFVRRASGSAVEGEAEYAFRHPLIREVAYEQIPRARRAGKHRLGAEWIDSLPADRAEHRADLLAHHYGLALAYLEATGGTAGDLAARAARALRDAGDHARALHSLDVAVERYARALELVENETERAEIGLALAETELRAGAVGEAHARLETVLLAARTGDRPELFARAALARGGVGITVHDADETLVALLEEALHRLGPRSPALRARLLARLAVEVYYLPPTSRREELSDEAVRVAREQGAHDALVDALNARHAALWSPDRLDERLEVARELVELADRLGDRERSLQTRTWLVLDLVESGDLDAARAEIDEYARLAEPLGIPAYAWWVPAWRAMLAVVEGRFDDARRLSDEALEIGEPVGDGNARIYWEILRWHADIEQGRRYDEWIPMAEAGIARGNAAGAYGCLLALTHALAGRPDEALRVLDDLVPDGLEKLPHDMNWYSAAAQLTRALGLLGDDERASAAYTALAPYSGRNCLTARAATTLGPVDSYLGRLAATAARYEEADTHFGAGIESAERMGHRVMAARTRWWYAEMLRARGGPGDRERAEELERASLEDAQSMELALPRRARTRDASSA